MKFNIHILIIAFAIIFLMGGHYFIKSTAYDFTSDEAGQQLRIRTFPLTLGTFEERCVDSFGKQILCRQLSDIQAGDILITKSSFTLFYRHGHVGLVVDADEGLVIEALGYGNYSRLEPLEDWNKYPTVKVLRLKNGDENLINSMVEMTIAEFLDIPYSIFARGNDLSRTHCSALIWKIFYEKGINLNSSNRPFVTPRSIANSPYLEVIQSYGFNSQLKW